MDMAVLTSAISVAKNPVLHSKTKHIEVRYHFLRQRREREDNLDPCTHTLQTSRYFHQTPRSSNFHSFAGGTWCVFDFFSWVCGSSFVAYV
jgi:hypothetical protein